MANYYYVKIKSDKMTQEVANEIFQIISEKNLIRFFNFDEGYLYYNSRGLTDITKILEKYGFCDEEIEVKDEFALLYENMDKIISPNISLEQFLYISNIENKYLFTSIEEREHCYRLKLIDSPKIGFSDNDYDKLKHLRIKEINFIDNIIVIELEKINV